MRQPLEYERFYTGLERGLAQKKRRNSRSLHLKSPLSPCIIMKNLVFCKKEAAMWNDFPLFLLSQLIPARGRKREFCLHWIKRMQVTTYPREGTETRYPVYIIPRLSHNLSPRGDGNMRKPPLYFREPVTTYPREGTETCLHFFDKIGCCVTTYPREGTETSVIVSV